MLKKSRLKPIFGGNSFFEFFEINALCNIEILQNENIKFTFTRIKFNK